MSDTSIDEYPEFSFSFTEQDLEKLDATVASVLEKEHEAGVDTPTEVDPVPSQTETVLVEDLEEPAIESSFASDAFDLNLGTLSAEELNLLDAGFPLNHKFDDASPAIEIEIEDTDLGLPPPSHSPKLSDLLAPLPAKSPLRQFRSHMSLSVSDLCAPSWCEVQYDYGLRGRRSRPVAQRPKSFVSSSGKTISPAVTVAKKNEVTTRQGLAVHKELEREIKFEELKVDITTPETRWALRLVNMIACLRGILDGFTREMPVFGIIHGEVVVGIMDEVTKTETSISPNNSGTKQHKRASGHPHSSPKSKRSKTGISPGQTPIDRFFASPGKSTSKENSEPEKQPSPNQRPIGYTLFIKDNKTRKSEYLPSEADSYSGRIQLMIYRRLLSELLTIDPPYNFNPLWNKLGLDSKEIFPTRFLVQAHLIKESDHFKTACLDDLVDSWHTLVKESNILGVSPNLELIYRLRPPPDLKGKQRATDPQETEPTCEDNDLASAIAASLGDVHASDDCEVAALSKSEQPEPTILDTVGEAIEGATGQYADLEDAQLQWALQQSLLPSTNTSRPIAEIPILQEIADALAAKLNSGKTGKPQGENGVRRFKIIGTKTFLYNDRVLDIHLARVLMWWKGERKPQGVSVEHSYRCSTCEYANDCEWRTEKALEYSTRKKL